MISKMNIVAALFLVNVLANAVAQNIEIPHPTLTEFKPDIRAMLAGARGRFELMQLRSEGEQLGIAYGRLGIHYYAHSVQDAARACFQNASQLDPGNHRWPYYLGVHFAETGDFQDATLQFKKALASQPGDLPAMTRLGLAFLELNQAALAESEFKAVLEADPSNAPALAGLARVAEERDDWSTAAGLYVQALAAQPEASQLHYRLGQVYRRLGEVDKATGHLEQRGARIPSIDDPLLQFMDAHSKPAGYYVALGDLALLENQADRAWKYYDFAHAIDPTQAGAVAGMARIRYLTGDVDRARTLVESALVLQPGNPSALQLQGFIDETDGKLDSAVGNYQSSLTAAPNPQTRSRLANLLMRLGRVEEARGHYDILADAEDAGANAKFRSAMANIAVGDCKVAESKLLSAYEMDPGMAKAIEALTRIYATCLDASDDQRTTALEYAQMMYDGQPGVATSETLAMTLAAQQKFEDAVDFQTQAIFEALKTGTLESQPQLKENMERYRNRQPATLPWPPGHSVFTGQ